MRSLFLEAANELFGETHEWSRRCPHLDPVAARERLERIPLVEPLPRLFMEAGPASPTGTCKGENGPRNEGQRGECTKSHGRFDPVSAPESVQGMPLLQPEELGVLEAHVMCVQRG